jgi:hypothetical protein
MSKKILAICAALVAFGALAIAPSMASASLTLQETEGGVTVTVAKEKKIIADGTGTSLFTDPATGGKVSCNENVMTGTVVKNDNNEIQATIEAAWFGSNLTTDGTKCSGGLLGNITVTVPGLTNAGGKQHWCIRTVPGKDTWQLWGNSCGTEPGTGELTFVLDLSSGTECKYKKTGVVEGTFNTTNTHETLELTLSGEPEFAREAGAFPCPAAGKLSNFIFAIYTDPDEKIVSGDVHAFTSGPTANPLFVTPEI